MEKTKVITKLDFRALKYCNLFLMKYQRKTKWLLVVVTLFALGIAAYGMFIANPRQYIFVVFGAIFALYSVYQIFTIEKKLDTTLVNFFRNRRVTTQTVEVDNEKIVVVRSVDPTNPIEYDWALISKIYEMPQYFMLMAGKNSPIIIDRNLEAILDGTKQNLDEIIHEQAKVKPYLATEEDIVKIPISYVHQELPTENAIEVENTINDVQQESHPVENEDTEEEEKEEK